MYCFYKYELLFDYFKLACNILIHPENRSIYSNTSSIVSPHWFYSSFFRTINVKKKVLLNQFTFLFISSW